MVVYNHQENNRHSKFKKFTFIKIKIANLDRPSLANLEKMVNIVFNYTLKNIFFIPNEY